MPYNIRINKAVPEKISNDNGLLKAMAVFYSIKFLYRGGIIKNLTSRYGEISRMIGISPNNLRNKIKRLEREGLVFKEGKNLCFTGFNEISKKFKSKTNKSFRIEHCGAKELEVKLKALAIHSNIQKQEFVIQKKVIEKEMRKFGKIEAKSTRIKIRKYLKKKMGSIINKHSRRELFSDPNMTNNKKINPDATMSRMGMARLFGRVSKSTGTRMTKKFKTFNILCKDEKRIQLMHRGIGKKVIRHLDLDTSFFVFKGCLYKRMTNNLEFHKFFA